MSTTAVDKSETDTDTTKEEVEEVYSWLREQIPLNHKLRQDGEDGASEGTYGFRPNNHTFKVKEELRLAYRLADELPQELTLRLGWEVTIFRWPKAPAIGQKVATFWNHGCTQQFTLVAGRGFISMDLKRDTSKPQRRFFSRLSLID